MTVNTTPAFVRRPCKAPGCDRLYAAHGWCQRHYSHIRRVLRLNPATLTLEAFQVADAEYARAAGESQPGAQERPKASADLGPNTDADGAQPPAGTLLGPPDVPLEVLARHVEPLPSQPYVTDMHRGGGVRTAIFTGDVEPGEVSGTAPKQLPSDGWERPERREPEEDLDQVARALGLEEHTPLAEIVAYAAKLCRDIDIATTNLRQARVEEARAKDVVDAIGELLTAHGSASDDLPVLDRVRAVLDQRDNAVDDLAVANEALSAYRQRMAPAPPWLPRMWDAMERLLDDDLAAIELLRGLRASAGVSDRVEVADGR